MEQDKLVNGEILRTAYRQVTEALEDPDLARLDRLYLGTQQLIIMFMMDDHPKTKLMYDVFRPVAWAIITVAGAALVAFATGHLSIILNFK